jgi:hypothetical protein
VAAMLIAPPNAEDLLSLVAQIEDEFDWLSRPPPAE